MRALSLALLVTLSALPAAAEPTEEASHGAIALSQPRSTLSPLDERAQAFTGPVKYRSRGTVTALYIKMKREMDIELVPVMKEGQLASIDTTVVDVAGGGKRWRADLPVTPRGTIRASEPKLVNATNILNIDPRLRERLKSGEGPIVMPGQIETEGHLRDVKITHRLADAFVGFILCSSFGLVVEHNLLLPCSCPKLWRNESGRNLVVHHEWDIHFNQQQRPGDHELRFKRRHNPRGGQRICFG